jgi:hypothetical protein
MGIPHIFITDNEYTLANRLAFRIASKIIAPEVVDPVVIQNLGGRREKIIQYPGLKEGIYLKDTKPSKKVLHELGLSSSDTIISIRPEPWLAQYYHDRSDFLIELIQKLINRDKYKIVLIPRDSQQRAKLERRFGSNVIIPKKAIDGPSLLYYSNLFVGAGGTMTRESAVLGTPTISVYHGQLLAADRYLIKRGYMYHTRYPKIRPMEAILREGKRRRSLMQDGRKAFKLIAKTITET